MKKIFLAMMALVAMSISAYAESVNVRFLAGHSIEGELVYRDDTLIRMIINPITRMNCATAGYVLMPFGAALTVVGIPLYVHGKRLAELKFNYTGNGAGIAMNF